MGWFRVSVLLKDAQMLMDMQSMGQISDETVFLMNSPLCHPHCLPSSLTKSAVSPFCQLIVHTILYCIRWMLDLKRKILCTEWFLLSLIRLSAKDFYILLCDFKLSGQWIYNYFKGGLKVCQWPKTESSFWRNWPKLKGSWVDLRWCFYQAEPKEITAH